MVIPEVKLMVRSILDIVVEDRNSSLVVQRLYISTESILRIKSGTQN
jgi:hypothetical protein